MRLPKNYKYSNGDMVVKLEGTNLEILLDHIVNKYRQALTGMVLFSEDAINVTYSAKLFEEELVDIPYIQRVK